MKKCFSMEIDRCSRCGLCHGLKRAVGLAENLVAEGWNVFTDGDLSHGDTLAKRLSSIGIANWDGKLREFGHRDCILIRSHGISPARHKLLNSLGCKIFDCTCPVVRASGKLVENLVAKGGYVIFFGKKNHPELIGLAGHGGSNLVACEDENDLAAINQPVDKMVALICQTTADGDKFSKFSTAAKKRFPTISVIDTACREVELRRSELREKLREKKFDALLVVGSKRSSNGRALEEIGKAAAVETFLVESAEELPKNFTDAHDKILIASATSTAMETVAAIEVSISAAAV
ncbi:MAG: hypothetical protein LBB38_03410 [Puniceicoccales bacterium]|jgi:(E)-4-hydroxy-3-methyl-but-2-enyl pyrophosphate reductase|nr:hypothetical protein [Puniceicoccales bacterium]